MTGNFLVRKMTFPVKIAPSILAADFSDLRSVASLCEKGGADYIHVDVMDNHFVPNLTIGPVVIQSLRPHTDRFLDVHLMVDRPDTLVEPFARSGADGITFHVEACDDPTKLIRLIRQERMQVGISLKPGTQLTAIEPYLDQVDLILIMSVDPGFGGQEYLPDSTKRIRELHSRLIDLGLRNHVQIEVDGGIKLTNAKEIAQAGADILVVGSGIFKTSDPIQTVKQFKSLVQA